MIDALVWRIQIGLSPYWGYMRALPRLESQGFVQEWVLIAVLKFWRQEPQTAPLTWRPNSNTRGTARPPKGFIEWASCHPELGPPSTVILCAPLTKGTSAYTRPNPSYTCKRIGDHLGNFTQGCSPSAFCYWKTSLNACMNTYIQFVKLNCDTCTWSRNLRRNFLGEHLATRPAQILLFKST